LREIVGLSGEKPEGGRFEGGQGDGADQAVGDPAGVGDGRSGPPGTPGRDDQEGEQDGPVEAEPDDGRGEDREEKQLSLEQA